MPFTPDLVPATELDAVNVLLMSIGQAPVNTLEVPGVKDVSFARLTLHNTSRQVQTRGWWFNRDLEVTLARDVSNEVPLAANILEVSGSYVGDQFVSRGGKLYDRVNQTFVFETAPVVNQTVFLAFEDLPQAARNYITHRAGRIFQSNFIGSPLLYNFTKELEVEAMTEMTRNDLRGKNLNVFNSPTRVNDIVKRRYRGVYR